MHSVGMILYQVLWYFRKGKVPSHTAYCKFPFIAGEKPAHLWECNRRRPEFSRSPSNMVTPYAAAETRHFKSKVTR